MTDATVRTRWYNLLYPALVWSMVALYVLFVVVPYFALGVYQYSYRDVVNQVAPSYSYASPFGIGALTAVVFVPWLSVLPGIFMLFNFPFERHAYSPLEQRLISTALIAHIITLLCIYLLPFGNIMSTWILD